MANQNTGLSDQPMKGLGCRVDRAGMMVEHAGPTVRVRPLPISIPFQRFQQMAMEAPDSNWSDLKVILGVDRADYTKGLVNRFKAYERLLSDYPEFLGKVKLINQNTELSHDHSFYLAR